MQSSRGVKQLHQRICLHFYPLMFRLKEIPKIEENKQSDFHAKKKEMLQTNWFVIIHHFENNNVLKKVFLNQKFKYHSPSVQAKQWIISKKNEDVKNMRKIQKSQTDYFELKMSNHSIICKKKRNNKHKYNCSIEEFCFNISIIISRLQSSSSWFIKLNSFTKFEVGSFNMQQMCSNAVPFPIPPFSSSYSWFLQFQEIRDDMEPIQRFYEKWDFLDWKTTKTMKKMKMRTSMQFNFWFFSIPLLIKSVNPIFLCFVWHFRFKLFQNLSFSVTVFLP